MHFLKKILSYFDDQPVERIKSRFSGKLEVTLSSGRYKLSTENAIYSFEDLYSNFASAFDELKIENYRINECLLLGLGMGSIPVLLKKKHLSPHYTGVEIDPAVVYLCKKYLLKSGDFDINYITADAYDFVRSADSSFDLICVDIFIDNVVPEKFEETAFLENVKKLLNPGGILLYNRLASSPATSSATDLFYEKRFRKIFNNSRMIRVGPNKMLCYFNT